MMSEASERLKNSYFAVCIRDYAQDGPNRSSGYVMGNVPVKYLVEVFNEHQQQAETIQQLKARIARFQSVIGYYVADMFNNGVTAGSLEKIKDVVNETPQQSAAEIQAAAVEGSVPEMLSYTTMTFAAHPDYINGYNQCLADVLNHADKLRQQAKGESNE